MTEPRTAAGRALLGHDIRTPAEGGTSPGYRKLTRAILAIEAEARAAALDEARAAVEAIVDIFNPCPDAVAAIDALREDADKK